MAPTKAERFLDGRLSGDLLEVPGIGAEHGIPNLNKHGIKTSYQLIGKCRTPPWPSRSRL